MNPNIACIHFMPGLELTEIMLMRYNEFCSDSPLMNNKAVFSAGGNSETLTHPGIFVNFWSHFWGEQRMLGQGGDNEPGEVPASLCARHRVCLSPTGKGAEAERRVGRGHGDPETILMRTSLRAGTIRAYMQKKMDKTLQKRNPLALAS